MIKKLIDWFLLIPYNFAHLISGVIRTSIITCKILTMQSYYPENKRKNLFSRIVDLVLWRIKYNSDNIFYNLYGLDIVAGNNAGEYMPEKDFWTSASNRNGLLYGNTYCLPASQIYYLRDKFAFYQFMKSHDLPVPEVFCLINAGKFYDVKLNSIDENALTGRKDFFVKDYDGQCASFVKHIKSFDDLKKYPVVFKKNGGYILQEAVHQAPEMNRINPNSINTLRIVTVRKGNQIDVLSGILRVGTSKTGNVDNWAAGGLAIGIDKDGHLAKYGFYKPQYGNKTNKHPDTGIVFTDTRISGYKEACEMCCKAHKYLYNLHSIGWDVALTDNGPVFIEGNDNWEISLMQACNGGLKNKWEDAIKEC